jgi:hypothetical protein
MMKNNNGSTNNHHLSKKIKRILGVNEPVELILDNCPLGFNLSEAGKISVKEIERSLKTMRVINGIKKD